MKLNQIVVDADKENEGDRVESPNWPGVFAKVRSIHYPKYRRALSIELQKLRRKYGSRPIPPDIQEEVSARLMVEYLLLDIEGLEDENDQPIAYTKQFGIEVMTKQKYRQLADFVTWATGVVGEEESEQQEEDEKNLAAV